MSRHCWSRSWEMPAGQVRSQALESGGSPRARLHLLFSRLHSLFLPPAPSHIHRWFSHLSWLQILLWELSAGGRKEEGSQSPLTLENKPKQPRRLMTQYTSGSRGPFPLGWAGAGGERHRHRECMITTSGSFSLGTEG